MHKLLLGEGVVRRSLEHSIRRTYAFTPPGAAGTPCRAARCPSRRPAATWRQWRHGGSGDSGGGRSAHGRENTSRSSRERLGRLRFGPPQGYRHAMGRRRHGKGTLTARVTPRRAAMRCDAMGRPSLGSSSPWRCWPASWPTLCPAGCIACRLRSARLCDRGMLNSSTLM